MSPKSLFNVVLKIFGLFLLRETIITIIQLLAAIAALFEPQGLNENSSSSLTLFSIAIIMVLAFAYAFLIYQLLYNTDRIIVLLKLDKGFNEDRFAFDFSRTWVLTVALIVVGGVMLTSEIPNLCRSIFSLIQERRLTHGIVKPNYSYTIVCTVKVLIGFLIIGERKRIIDFVEKKQS